MSDTRSPDIRTAFDGVVTEGGKSVGRTTTRNMEELKAIATETPTWLMEHFLMPSTMAVISGSMGSGKSLLALDIGLSYAGGRSELYGKRLMNTSGEHERAVFYVDGENSRASYAQRVLAWGQKNHDLNLGFEVLPHFTRWEMGEVTMSDEPGLVERLTASFVGNDYYPQLVIFDTLSTLAGVESEQDNADFMRLMNAIRVMHDTIGCCVLVMAHPSKEVSARLKELLEHDANVDPAMSVRGASAVAQRASSMFVIANSQRAEKSSDNNISLIRQTKMRDGNAPWITRSIRIGGRKMDTVGGPISVPVIESMDSHKALALGVTRKEESTLEVMRGGFDDDSWHSITEYGEALNGSTQAISARTLRNYVGKKDFRDAFEKQGVAWEMNREKTAKKSWHFKIEGAE